MSDQIEHFWSQVEKTAGCWFWRGARLSTGYGRVSLFGRVQPAHRVAWLFARDCTLTPSLWVCHHCDTPPCVNPDHLFVGTPRQNVLDMLRKGRGHAPRGAQHYAARRKAVRLAQQFVFAFMA